MGPIPAGSSWVSYTWSSSTKPMSSGRLSGLRSVRPLRVYGAGHTFDGRQAQPYGSMDSRPQPPWHEAVAAALVVLGHVEHSGVCDEVWFVE